RISMAAHAVRLKCSDARFRARAEIRACRSRSLLRLCPRRPAPCQTRTQECDSNDVQISVHWSDSFSLDFLVFAALPCTLQLSYPGVLFHAEQGSAAHGLALLIADPAPGEIQMILQSRSHHFDPADLAVFDLERLGDFQARWPIEILHRYILAVGEVDRLNGAILIEDHVRPDDSALFINDRKTPVMNPSDYCIVATLELRNAAQRKSVERSVRRQRRIVRRMNSVFYAVTIVAERIHPFPVVVLQAREVHISGRNQLLARNAPCGWNCLEPQRFGLAGVQTSGVRRTAAALPIVCGFDFRDSSELHAQ